MSCTKAYYSQKLDEIIAKSDKYIRTSSGKTQLYFTPNPEKSFRRSNTDYFLFGRHKHIIQIETPKSTGEPLGKLSFVGKNYLEVDTPYLLNNGDGLSFITRENELEGFRVNRVEDKKIFPHIMPDIQIGTQLYRNYDKAFDQELQTKTAERKIAVDMLFQEEVNGFRLTLKDEDGHIIEQFFEYEKQLAKQADKAVESIENQLSKTGQTIFKVHNITIDLKEMWFFPASVLNDWRRKSLDALSATRIQNYEHELAIEKTHPPFPDKSLSYTGNVTNNLAREFYERCGVEEIAPGFEIKAEAGVPLMFTKHCIKYEMGWCDRYGGHSEHPEPLHLHYKDQAFELSFDCKNCQMLIKSH